MADPAATPTKPPLNVVFTIPRTSSHLLIQILNLPAQPSIHKHASDGYFFLAPLVQRFKRQLSGKDVSLWKDEDVRAVKEACQISYDGFEKFLLEAKGRGKGVFVKEHVNWFLDPTAESRYLHSASNGLGAATTSPFTIIAAGSRNKIVSGSNETSLPDEVLLRLRPTFLIRNPMLTFPSLLRTSIDNEGRGAVMAGAETQRWEMSFHWSRALYEFYVEQRNLNSVTPVPIILDADDILNPDLMRTYAQTVGLDPNVIRYEWEKASEEEVGKLAKTERRMKDTILASQGIVKGKTAEGMQLDSEIEKWKVEFGEDLAARLEGFVRAAMEDYEWLWERRLNGQI